MNAVTQVIDKDLALARAGGNSQLAEELFAMLLKELPEQRTSILEAASAHDYQNLKRFIHKLNGSATYCGVPALKEAVDGFETRLKRGEIEDAPERVRVVVEEIDRVLNVA